MGAWITFEGLGGSGKSTQVKLLSEWLDDNNIGFVLTKEPGGTHLGLNLRTILKEKQDPPIELLTELLLFEADRHETVQKIVRPNINDGKIVLSDRGIDGSLAYQGYGRGMDLDLIDSLTKIATGQLEPDLTFFIDVDPTEAQRRVYARDERETDQFDLNDLNFQCSVQQGFYFAAENNTSRVKIIDGMRSVKDVHKSIISIVQSFLINKQLPGGKDNDNGGY